MNGEQLKVKSRMSFYTSKAKGTVPELRTKRSGVVDSGLSPWVKWLWASVFIVLFLLFTAINTGSVEQPSAKVSLPNNQLFSLELRDVELKDVLRALGQVGGLNVVVGEKVTGKVTLSFDKVSLMDAFNAILKANNLAYYQDGNIVYVITAPVTLEEEYLTFKTFPMNYADPKEVSTLVKGLLSSKGMVTVDSRTGTLLVKDVPANIERVSNLIKEVTGKPQQVMIEARIVEVSKTFGQALGVEWGGTYTTSGTPKWRQTIRGATGVSSFSGSSNYAVNLPAVLATAASVNPFGAIGLTFGNITNTKILELRLSALEQSGEGKVLSNPRILTMNNKPAIILTGTKVKVVIQPTTTTGTTTTTTTTTATSEQIEATLKLEVTPQVTADGGILMLIKTKRDEFDWSRAVQGYPAINTREAETTLSVMDGETVVIGGIYTKKETAQESGIPFLSKIPILGWLFKSKTEMDEVSELMIFITPKIHKS
ncbi:MAG: type IV pilus secretin PilQ [Nitrospirota bacterium]